MKLKTGLLFVCVIAWLAVAFKYALAIANGHSTIGAILFMLGAYFFFGQISVVITASDDGRMQKFYGNCGFGSYLIRLALWPIVIYLHDKEQ